MLLAAQEPASAPPYLLQAAELDPARKEASELAFTIQRALPEGNLVYSLVASGRKLADIGKWELAAYAFQRAVDLQPQSGEAWAFLGESLQHLENPANEKAYEALVEALDIDPGSLAPNVFMALYWQRAGKPDVAVEFLTAAVKIDPNNPDIFVDLGTAVAMAGDLETAHHHYWHAIELTYRHPVYLRELTRFYIQYNFNLQEIALPIAREIVQSDPTDPASLDIMGQVLFRLGDLYNAERFFIRAVNLDPNYAPAHLHLGLAYNLQDKTNLAKAAFARAISLAPGTQTAILAERFFDDADLRLENASP
jgi:Flp pilus assembly protein TadD